MEMQITIEVEQKIKHGIPLGFYWLVPKSWHRVHLDGVDITDHLEADEINALWEDQPWFKANIDVMVEVEGKVRPGTPDYFCQSMGNWHPGDFPEVECEVYLGKLDITGLVDADEMNRIENKFYEQWEEEEPEYEREDYD